MNGESGSGDHRTLDSVDSARKRSFHVLYVDADNDVRCRVRDELTPTYPVTTAESLAEAADSTDPRVDCVVVAGTLAASDGLQFLEQVRTVWSDLPVILFGHTPDACVLEGLLEVDNATAVSRSDTETSPSNRALERLRSRLDEQYERSISDVRATVLDIARLLISAAPDEIDVEIEWALKLIGRRLDADRCLVFDYHDDILEPTHCWSDGERRSLGPSKVATDSFPGFELAIQSFDPVAVPPKSASSLEVDVPDEFVGSVLPGENWSDSDADARAHPYLSDRNLESLLAVPIVVEWELVGVLAIEQETKRSWPRSLQQQLKTLGELVGYTLEREERRRELARQNERLEQFSAVVSHDLRNPLNVLTGYAELIAETGDTEHIDEVLASAERMETMIDDLLALAQDGATLDDLQQIQLEELVTTAWDGVETGEATLETRHLDSLECDPGRLRQLFENLFRNAIEHGSTQRDTAAVSETGSEAPPVTVRVEGIADGFAVEDDGPGIPPENRDAVFREGYTGGSGTGLGLSIVETVAEAHGWSVSVESGDLGGARFTFATEESPRESS
ncbi:ATP-binding protein [Natrarchaeobaculum sulfurireducens]|uniref:histidine kinase n=1 Tax=Natrarchaeobaculum sulfurireducens TaxID=2044521 RepID=A0A346PS24_9EURY|nr:ATP-binding protein [Natrarchaeobaculum sulfurireducens]AXR82319.1 hypothetical protein AArcMg_2325 [Natrarchaeobaculum sulfurireducens]